MLKEGKMMWKLMVEANCSRDSRSAVRSMAVSPQRRRLDLAKSTTSSAKGRCGAAAALSAAGKISTLPVMSAARILDFASHPGLMACCGGPAAAPRQISSRAAHPGRPKERQTPLWRVQLDGHHSRPSE
ncbi:MAG TPA: hypothetical protein VE684_14605, partial [Crenalkalicoccus sp.]|nr:hypothetical protein [Crenalkalicoccus sp.]